MVRKDQVRIPMAYVRGGSSKAVFFHEKDIPPPGSLRDAVLKRVMGTPDPLQIDGMGGTKAVTSKIAIISPSDRPGIDIDFMFAQVGVSDDAIAYDANCGNISSGVGPFAIEEGLVKDFRPGRTFGDYRGRTQEVRIFNTGTHKKFVAHVPIDDEGCPITTGDFEIAAVPGTGAPILLDYRETKGASQNKGLLPSGHALDKVEIQGKMVEITICDIGNICVFASAQDFDVLGQETAASLTENKKLIALLKELRGKAAQLVGMCKDWEKVDEQSPFMPMPVLVAPPPSSKDHVSGRLFLDNMCHESMAGTGSVCFAACSRIEGSVVNKIVDPKAQQQDIFRIAHPRGMLPVAIEMDESTRDTIYPIFKTLSFVRTSRRLMDGNLYVPKTVFDSVKTAETNGTHFKANGIHKTNGVGVQTNGKENCVNEKAITDIPVTKILAEFISSVQTTVLTPELRLKLKEVLIDYIGVAIGGSKIAPSTESICDAVYELGANIGSGKSTVITKGNAYHAQYAGFLNATFAHSMDFDDTYAEGSLHAGVTAISAALTQAELLGDSVDTERFLLAIAIGYEITCRLGRELSFDAYSRGFHNTSTAGIFGAIAAISILKDLSSRTIEMAFGLAGSKAAGSMQYLDNGSWNKRLHAGFAVHDAFICVSLADAGVIGATRAIEGQFGFLQAYSPNPNKDMKRLVSNLGEEWIWSESALKPFPACRMTHCFIEMAGEMGYAAGNTKPVKRIQLSLTPANYSIVGERTHNKLNPENIVDAQFSAYYQTANAWLYGSNTGIKTYDRLGETEINMFCKKIECVVLEKGLSKFASTIEVEYEDGSHDKKHMDHPLGEVEHPFTRDRVDSKFFGLVETVYGKIQATKVRDMVDDIEKFSASQLLSLLQ